MIWRPGRRRGPGDARRAQCLADPPPPGPPAATASMRMPAASGSAELGGRRVGPGHVGDAEDAALGAVPDAGPSTGHRRPPPARRPPPTRPPRRAARRRSRRLEGRGLDRGVGGHGQLAQRVVVVGAHGSDGAARRRYPHRRRLPQLAPFRTVLADRGSRDLSQVPTPEPAWAHAETRAAPQPRAATVAGHGVRPVARAGGPAGRGPRGRAWPPPSGPRCPRTAGSPATTASFAEELGRAGLAGHDLAGRARRRRPHDPRAVRRVRGS